MVNPSQLLTKAKPLTLTPQPTASMRDKPYIVKARGVITNLPARDILRVRNPRGSTPACLTHCLLKLLPRVTCHTLAARYIAESHNKNYIAVTRDKMEDADTLNKETLLQYCVLCPLEF